MPDWQTILGSAEAPRLTLVLGGARSGKSTLAEALTRAVSAAAAVSDSPPPPPPPSLNLRPLLVKTTLLLPPPPPLVL